MRIRIEIGTGWYPNPGLVVDHDGHDWVVEEVMPDADSIHRINYPHRFTVPQSVMVTMRLASEAESAESRAMEDRDTKEMLASIGKRR